MEMSMRMSPNLGHPRCSVSLRWRCFVWRPPRNSRHLHFNSTSSSEMQMQMQMQKQKLKQQPLPITVTTPSKRSRRSVKCGGLVSSSDAPFAIAIGASMLSSLILSHPPHHNNNNHDDDDDDADVDADAKLVVMSIISFVPFFNWLSWIFAFMDSGQPRYAVYAAVYLAPYLRTNLSLSPEDSWLPVSSILLCVLHVQLEASIINGDLDASVFFDEAAKHFGLDSGIKDKHSTKQGKLNKGRELDNMGLPTQTHSTDETEKWKLHRKSSWDVKDHNEDSDQDDETQK